MDFSVWVAIAPMLVRLSLTLAPPPIKYCKKHHCMSPVVHIGDKAEEGLPQEVDGLLCMGGDHWYTRLEAVPVSYYPPPSSLRTVSNIALHHL
jgi:hypothetical protein